MNTTTHQNASTGSSSNLMVNIILTCCAVVVGFMNFWLIFLLLDLKKEKVLGNKLKDIMEVELEDRVGEITRQMPAHLRECTGTGQV
jgi:hypothetical protein